RGSSEEKNDLMVFPRYSLKATKAVTHGLTIKFHIGYDISNRMENTNERFQMSVNQNACDSTTTTGSNLVATISETKYETTSFQC
ncbi:hypothetical protein RCK19_25550, partial [Salmonella enterica subsp. enterica serovar 1,4,[5],12:i:-]